MEITASSDIWCSMTTPPPGRATVRKATVGNAGGALRLKALDDAAVVVEPQQRGRAQDADQDRPGAFVDHHVAQVTLDEAGGERRAAGG